VTSPLPPTIAGPENLLRAQYTILVTDANLNVLGDPIHEWSSLQATLKWKEPGSGSIVVPAHQYVQLQLQPGCRICVVRKVLGQSNVMIAGPMEKKLWERSDNGENGGVGTRTINFADDTASIARRLAWPDPSKAPAEQTTDYWTYTGNPEQAMLQLVNTQCGPGAMLGRRVPKLVVAPFSGISGTGTIKLGPTTDVNPRERLEPLTDVLRKICTLGVGSGQHPDSLGFRTRMTTQDGEPVILFEPIRARDLTGQAHFSFNAGNLKYFAYEESAPTITYAIVGGSGEGADRFINSFTRTDVGLGTDTWRANRDWGWWEQYIPRPGTSSIDEMKDAARQAFEEGNETGRLASNAADTADLRFDVHYGLGDIVSIELDRGNFVKAPVQTVNVQAWPTAGEVVGTTIGDQSARTTTAWIKQMRAMEKRIAYLERR